MPSDKEKGQQVTQQVNQPWGPAQPYLQDVLKNTNELYNGNIGYKPWEGNVLAPMHPTLTSALDNTMQMIQGGVKGLPEAQNFATGMLANNGLTDDLRGVAQGIRGGMDQVSGYLTPFANGSMQEDPRLAAMLDTNANRAANAAATRFGGGRYGSASIGQGVGSAVADANNATMLQSNENARNRQLQAAQALGSFNLQGNGLLGNLYEGGLGRAAQAASMLPTLNELQYDPLTRAAGIGDYYQSRLQAEKDADIASYEAGQARPWEQLGRFNALISGAGQMGGTQTGIKPKTSSSGAQKAIGGAASGLALGAKLGSAVPGIGTGFGAGLGAVGGGLLGLFG